MARISRSRASRKYREFIVMMGKSPIFWGCSPFIDKSHNRLAIEGNRANHREVSARETQPLHHRVGKGFD